MSPILRALRLFSRERGLWKYAVRPLLWGALAFALVVLVSAGLGERVGERVGGLFGGVAGTVLGTAVPLVFGPAIYLALVGLIAGFGFDRLSVEVEERAFGRAVGRPIGFVAGLRDGVARAVLAGVLGFVALCLSGTVVVPWLLAAGLGLMDFTGPALLRRGVGFGRQFGVVRRIPGALPFALVSGLLLIVPIVNVLALPILVAAGTLLVAQEGRTDAFRTGSANGGYPFPSE